MKELPSCRGCVWRILSGCEVEVSAAHTAANCVPFQVFYLSRRGFRWWLVKVLGPRWRPRRGFGDGAGQGEPSLRPTDLLTIHDLGFYVRTRNLLSFKCSSILLQNESIMISFWRIFSALLPKRCFLQTGAVEHFLQTLIIITLAFIPTSLNLLRDS